MIDGCFMIRQRGGGGNAAFKELTRQSQLSTIVVRRNAAIGDVLAASVVADKLVDLGHRVSFQCNPIIHCILKRRSSISEITRPAPFYHVDLDGCYENHPQRTKLHFSELFIDKANRDLSRLGINLGMPINCRPVLNINDKERELVAHKFSPYPKPHVFVCPRSDFYSCRQVPDGIWQEAAKYIVGTKFWIGRHPAPKGFIDLKTSDLDTLTTWISAADLMLSVDTGPMHIAAALGVPVVALCQSSSPELHLSDQRDFISIQPEGLNCLNCQRNVCPISAQMPPCQKFNPERIAYWANRKLRYITDDGVSAIVPIYQPDVQILNRCLDALIPQVDEIIVTMEGRSLLPIGSRTHEKIRYVRKNTEGIGYGRNVNFGVRHSCNRLLLLINDDVFLPPDAVQKLREKLVSQVGMAVHQLRFPDGKIYPVAMGRRPGERDWYHMDFRASQSTYQTDTELETCCGASELVRREAFYKIGGFDEGFFIYCEDNDFALRIRQAGWKLLFAPQICGIHINGASTKKLGIAQQELISKSGTRFHAKWDRYLEHNKLRFPGTFDYA